MKNILLQDDVLLVEERLKQFETHTGCELLLVVANSSDPYPGASWRFGVMAGFLISLCFSYYFEFHHTYLWPLAFLIITIIMTWIGHYNWAKKLALSDWETERETYEKSLECFHLLGTTKVKNKVSAMIMVSVLEKKITVMIDEKLKTKIPQNSLTELVQIMQGHFQKGSMANGFIQSIDNLEKNILQNFQGRVSEATPSQLQDTIIFLA